MSVSSWTLPLAVCAAMASPLRLARIARKVPELQLRDTPACCVCSEAACKRSGLRAHLLLVPLHERIHFFLMLQLHLLPQHVSAT